MKKNLYWSMMIAFVMAVMSVGFASCGGDDDDEIINGGSITIIEPVQERLKAFVGFWEIKANDHYHEVTYPNYDILFFQDSKCVITRRNHSDNNELLSWDYDESNKYLSLAGEAKGQWQITSIGDDAWTGLALWYQGNNGYSAKKKSIYNVVKYHFDNAEWMCDSVKAYIACWTDTYNLVVTKEHEITEKTNGDTRKVMAYYNYYMGTSFLANYTENKENDIIECEDSSRYSDGKTSYKIQIVHPYSYKDVYMNITIKDEFGEYSGKFLPKRN